MNLENEFFLGKLGLDYGNQKIKKELIKVSKNIDWLRGWPDNKKAFWNGEAFMWSNKIDREKRDLIKQELNFLKRKKRSVLTREKQFILKKKKKSGKKLGQKENRNSEENKNLDLGCGSFSYLPSIGFDLSEKMLLLNDNLKEKIRGNLEQKLPFNNQEFESATLIFVLNYIRNYSQLLREVFRVLKKDGNLVVIQSKNKVNSWQRQHSLHDFNSERWKEIIESVGFRVKVYDKEGLCFFHCFKNSMD